MLAALAWIAVVTGVTALMFCGMIVIQHIALYWQYRRQYRNGLRRWTR